MIPRHMVTHCLAANNKSSGFYANHHPGGGDWIHNSAYGNRANFNFLCRDFKANRDVPGFDHVISNNLGFQGRAEVQNIDETKCRLDGNLFGGELSKRDFVSLDTSELTAPRQADGSLPEINFMRPKESGDFRKDPVPGAFELSETNAGQR